MLQAGEIGHGKGQGYNFNIPLPNGTGDNGYELAMKELVVPQVEKYNPELIVFIFGQDSSQVGSCLLSICHTHCASSCFRLILLLFLFLMKWLNVHLLVDIK